MLEARCSTAGTTPWVVCVRAADPHKIPIDPNGNLTAKTEGTDTWVYTWNAENQLTRVEKNAVEVARFAYDPLARRVEKVAGGVTTSYAYDRLSILREARGTATLKYVHGPGIDEPLALDDGAALSYLHADVLGSVTKVTNAAGAIALTRQYDAWGNLEVGTGEPGYAFTGREWEPDVALYYYRSRQYDPRVGRFISEDPVVVRRREVRELNPYAYVASNPVTETDPLGLAIWVCNRKAFTKYGPGNHSYYWDDRNGACCGRGSTKTCKEAGPPKDDCRIVWDSSGREDEILNCCRATADQGWWWPGGDKPEEGNDCHTAVDRCLKAKGMTNPGAPGGRVGPPCDPCSGRGPSGGSH